LEDDYTAVGALFSPDKSAVTVPGYIAKINAPRQAGWAKGAVPKAMLS
jgi:hypothetical protein